ncbi:hypothetical protein AEAC466_17160 [Asticcacaulis sp. AC466]|nr:hypothetical protein AEAC466_17160 [Asticcacaulis sp. AC466]
MTQFDLSGKVALVTGGNKGLGQGIALALARAGADIAAVGTSDADETARRVQALGRRFVFIKADLSTIAPIDPIISSTVNSLGGLDILVNNSGLIRRADAVDFTETDWDDVMNVNIKAAFFLCQAAGRHMLAHGHGKIINIASMLSFQGGIRVPSYTASKSGVAGITRLLANEWAARGINVNAIAPGYMATDTTLDVQKRSWPAFRRPAGARPTTWPALRFSWHRAHPITSTAPLFRLTAAGWHAELAV